MKKYILVLFILCVTRFGFAQTTATNFNVADCNSNAHDLFAELDAGKVIVLVWVMPCGSCISPAQTTYNVVQSYASSQPGRVKFYLCDDAANTVCSSLGSWATTNSITSPDAMFSDATISESNYGGSGMPHIVVLGRTTHNVFYNIKNTVNSANLIAAIDNALNPATSIPNLSAAIVQTEISPNPANYVTDFSYSLSGYSDVSVQVFNILGDKVKTLFAGKQNSGNYTYSLDCADLRNGLYFIKFISNEAEQTLKFSVSH